MRDGTLDASFYYGNLEHPDVAAVPLIDFAYRVVAPATWGDRIQHASWDEIVAMPWIMSPPISTLRTLAEELFDERGSSPVMRVEADNEAVIRSLVVAGGGVALMREDVALGSGGRGRSRALEQRAPRNHAAVPVPEAARARSGDPRAARRAASRVDVGARGDARTRVGSYFARFATIAPERASVRSKPTGSNAMSSWVNHAIETIEADFQRSADTHLIRVDLPSLEHVQLYLKDESTHPTGSLKHRLARSLFLFGLCNGWIREGTTIIEASSGSTAVSEAYFARLLRLPFVAVIPRGTSQEKFDQITFYGGTCQFVAASDMYAEAHRLRARVARALHGPVHLRRAGHRLARQQQHRRIDLRADALRGIPDPCLDRDERRNRRHLATIGRYIRYKRHDTQLCVADPEHSVFHEYFRTRDPELTLQRGSNIEGIGRPRVEPSFVPGVIDRMITVPDAAAFATIRFLEGILNRKCGGSTGTNLYAAFQIASELSAQGQRCSVVSMILRLGRPLSRHLLQRPVAGDQRLRHRALSAAADAFSGNRPLAAARGSSGLTPQRARAGSRRWARARPVAATAPVSTRPYSVRSTTPYDGSASNSTTSAMPST